MSQRNCTLWQVLVCGSAGVTCQCVQCGSAKFQNFCAVGEKIKTHSGRQCMLGFCLSVSFFIPSLIFHFHCQFAVSVVFSPLVHNGTHMICWGGPEHLSFIVH